MVRHHLAKPVHMAVTHLQNAPAIAQHCACFQLSESDNLRDMVVAIFLLDIADDFTAPRLAKVDVEVWHGNALGVQKPLEQQAKLDRIEIGDGERPCDD